MAHNQLLVLNMYVCVCVSGVVTVAMLPSVLSWIACSANVSTEQMLSSSCYFASDTHSMDAASNELLEK